MKIKKAIIPEKESQLKPKLDVIIIMIIIIGNISIFI